MPRDPDIAPARAPLELHASSPSEAQRGSGGSSAERRGSARLLAGGLLAACVALAGPAAADPSELPSAFGYNYGETDTARSGGMAGAVRALGGAADGVFVNPANMGLTRSYHVDLLGQFTPEAGRHIYGGSIVDSTRRFSGGFGFTGGFQDADGLDRSHLDVRFNLAFAISDRFHIGVGGRYLSLEQEGFGPLGEESRASGGRVNEGDRESLVDTFTLDAGTTIIPVEGLHIAIVGKNLSYPDNALLPTTVGGGIGYGTDDFSVEVDGLADFNSWPSPSPRVMAGGEVLVVDRIPIRLGYRFDMMNGSGLDPSHQLGGGLGYVDPAFGIQASVRRTLVGPSATTIMAQVSLHLEAFGLPIDEY